MYVCTCKMIAHAATKQIRFKKKCNVEYESNVTRPHKFKISQYSVPSPSGRRMPCCSAAPTKLFNVATHPQRGQTMSRCLPTLSGLWGSLFLRASVRPNMMIAEMPKSVSFINLSYRDSIAFDRLVASICLSVCLSVYLSVVFLTAAILIRC